MSNALKTLLTPLLTLIDKKADRSEIPKIPRVPTKLSELRSDSAHRTVSDDDVAHWDSGVTTAEAAKTTAEAAKTTAEAAKTTADKTATDADIAIDILSNVYTDSVSYTMDDPSFYSTKVVVGTSTYVRICPIGTPHANQDIRCVPNTKSVIELNLDHVIHSLGQLLYYDGYVMTHNGTMIVTDAYGPVADGLKKNSLYVREDRVVKGDVAAVKYVRPSDVTRSIRMWSPSNKKFEITVDDSGTITATEVTE